MAVTSYPLIPREVAELSVPEFTFNGDMSVAPSLDVVCRRFENDENRALVWLIRYRALQTWCAHAEAAAWLEQRRATARDAYEIAARFPLNEGWEFDAVQFCSAIETLVTARSDRSPNSGRATP